MANKNLLRQNNSSIEVYRSSDAAPDNWEDAKFWLVNELRRIQNGFFSVDDVVAGLGSGEGEVGDTIIQNITSSIVKDGATIEEIINNPVFQSLINGIQTTPGPEGPEGPEGPQGPAGADGDAGDLIADYKIALDYTWSSEKIAEEIGAGLEEAPQDGTPYNRQNATWVPAVARADYFVDGGFAGGAVTAHWEGGAADSDPADVTVIGGSLMIST